jgi:hypothetical protein
MARPVGHPDNVTIAKLAVNEYWAQCEDRTAATAEARKAAEGRFLVQARERFGDLPPDELAFRAEKLKQAHFQRMALRSAQARRKRTSSPKEAA